MRLDTTWWPECDRIEGGATGHHQSKCVEEKTWEREDV